MSDTRRRQNSHRSNRLLAIDDTRRICRLQIHTVPIRLLVNMPVYEMISAYHVFWDLHQFHCSLFFSGLITDYWNAPHVSWFIDDALQTSPPPFAIFDIRYVARRCSRKIASVAYRLSLSDTFKLDIATSSVWKCCTWFNECYSVSRAHALLVGSWLVHQVSCCLKPNSTKENHNES